MERVSFCYFFFVVVCSVGRSVGRLFEFAHFDFDGGENHPSAAINNWFAPNKTLIDSNDERTTRDIRVNPSGNDNRHWTLIGTVIRTAAESLIEIKSIAIQLKSHIVVKCDKNRGISFGISLFWKSRAGQIIIRNDASNNEFRRDRRPVFGDEWQSQSS